MKAQIKIVRGSTAKAGTTYTFAFASQELFQATKDQFKKLSCLLQTEKAVKTVNGWEAHYLAPNQAVLRTALRKVKESGIAIYKKATPKYLASASKETLKLSKSLKTIAKIEAKKVEKAAKKVKKTIPKMNANGFIPKQKKDTSKKK